MAKSARAFQMPEEDREDLPSPAVQKETLSRAPKVQAAPPAVPTARPAYREGRRNLSVWLDAKAFNSFKAMVAEDGGTIGDYVIDMINREFARRGRPQIAKK